MALPPGLRRLLIEAAAIAGALALAGFLVFHLTVHTIRNTRPLGGLNVDVSPEEGNQTETAFAIDPSRPRVLVGALGALEVYMSTDGGRRWRGRKEDTRCDGVRHSISRTARQVRRLA